MSHIDSFKHELIGYLGYLPVYHPLEDIDGDFFCTTKQIVIGGGSGEHPAVVLEEPLYAVALFIHHILGRDNRLIHWEPIIAPYLNVPYEDMVQFYEWDDDRFTKFYKMLASNGVLNPSDEDNGLEWFVLGLGEFIFYAMPQLATEIISQVLEPYKDCHHIFYNNIMIVPPNMPVYANGGNMFFKKLN